MAVLPSIIVSFLLISFLDTATPDGSTKSSTNTKTSSVKTAGSRYRLCEVEPEDILNQPLGLKPLTPPHCPYSVRPTGTPSEFDLPPGTKAIYIAGKPEGKKSFQLKLLYHPTCFSGGPYIPLQIKIDLETSRVIRNTFTGGYWGVDEDHLSGNFTFESEKIFQMTLRGSENCTDAFVNGGHLFNFVYRSPPKYIKKLRIEGDVEVVSVSF